ncbi:MAG: hypothetical protein A2X46_15795 [Lentisphaerae bacterium GWF2_57_35]|nr:MAG: hypothetical protein A2X46_15795 [Lentisphaerae bacterium GWF2_57_35]
MSGRLSKLLKGEFDYSIRQRGDGYFREQRVRIEKSDKNLLEAWVKGSKRYDILLTLKEEGGDRVLYADCSCPYFEDIGLCKHVWATLLQADAEGILQPPDDGKSLFLDSPFMDGDRLDSRFEPSLSPIAAGKTFLKPLPPPPPPSDWKVAMKEVEEKTRYAPPPSFSASANAVVRVGCEARFEISLDEYSYAGELSIRPLCRIRRQSGDWGKWKALKLGNTSAGMDKEDYLLAAALIGESISNRYGYGYNNAYVLHKSFGERLIPRLCATGHLYARKKDREFGPLAWDDRGPWSFELEMTADAEKKEYRLRGRLVRGDEQCPLSAPLAFLSSGWIIWPDRISLVNDPASHAWVAVFQKRETLSMPEREGRDFVSSLLATQRVPRLKLPPEFEFAEVRATPKPQLAIRSSANRGYQSYDVLTAQWSFDYDGCIVDAMDESPVVHDVRNRKLYVRDREAEKTAGELFFSLGGRTSSYYAAYSTREDNCEIKASLLPRLVAGLVAAGWEVKAKGKLYRKSGAFDVQVQSGIDWFDLQVRCDFDGKTASLPALLEALRKKESWVKLDDGSLGILPEEWLQKYGLVAAMGTVEGDAVRFKSHQAGLLDAWLAAQPEARIDEVFARVKQQWMQFDSIQAEEAPSDFIGTLRPYQKIGLGWLEFLRQFGFGGCLADDMGLGKTVQVLALLEKRRALRAAGSAEIRRPSLVVAPRSLVFNWQREAANFAPQLRVLDHTGTTRMRDTSALDGYDLILTTYGTLRKDIGLLKEYPFDYLVLDESQAIKNAGALTAKAVRLLQGQYRLALSGTPIENHLGELWSLFEFLNPGLLGVSAVFGEKWTKDPDAEARALLAKALRPFILRRTKAQVAPDLPARQEETLYCELPPTQRKLYDELKEHYRQSLMTKIDQDGLNRSKIHVLEALLRLRQAACHPGLLDAKQKNAASAKLETLLPQIQEVVEEGHKALVFSQFTSFLSIVRAQLDEQKIVYEYLDGRTRHRQQVVDRFQSDKKCPLFLISLKAGGLGLNLTAAEYVFLLDPWWNPAVEAQAIDRAHRIGQANKVFAYRLIAKDTIEEKVLALQETKRDLANALINQDNALLRNLTRDDLAFLLG